MTPIWKECLVKFYVINQSIHMYIKIRRITGEYRSKYITFAHFSLVSLRINPRERRGAERIRQGEGCWSRPPKTALGRSDLTEKFPFRAPYTEAETKKNS